MEEQKQANSFNKILGVVLLLAGLGLMGYSLYGSLQIFQGAKEAPQLFELTAPEPTTQQISLQDLENQIPDLLKNQVQGLLPYEELSRMMNLGAWSIFAGILLFGGAQVAGLGIKLMKL